MPDKSAPRGGGGRHRAASRGPTAIPTAKQPLPRTATPKPPSTAPTNQRRPQPYPRQSTPKPARRRMVAWARTSVRAVLITLCVALLCGGAYAHVAFDRLGSGIPTIDAVPQPGQPGVPATDVDGAAENLLLAQASGTDLRAIWLLHLPTSGARLNMVLLPRDAYVALPSGGAATLATTYARTATADPATALRTLAQTVSELTGLRLDDVIRAQAGPVPPALAATSPCAQPKAPDADQLADQVQTATAMRHLLDGGQLLNPFKFQRLLDALGGTIAVDPRMDFPALAQRLAYLTPSDVTVSSIPNSGYSSSLKGAVVVDPASVRAYLGKLVGARIAAPPTLGPDSVNMVLLNGSGQSQESTSSAEALRKVGFVIETVGDTSPTERTVVRYRYGQQAQAQLVASVVPGATVMESDTVTKVTLVLGSDGLHVAANASPSVKSEPPSSAPMSRTAADTNC